MALWPMPEVYAGPMAEPTAFVVITRYRVEDFEAWLPEARAALAPLVTQDWCLGGDICAAVDDPHLAVITTQWPTVGAYRRAMSSFDVKMHTVPLLSMAVDEPTAFEVIHHNDPHGAQEFASARALDADSVGLGDAASASVRARLRGD